VDAASSIDALQGHRVRLIPSDAPTLETSLDDLGNFEFEHVVSGSYTLEFDLPSAVIAVEQLRVD
jgi:hypothetical protein